MKIISALYWLSVFALVHSYFFYPLYRWFKYKNLRGSDSIKSNDVPAASPKQVSVILSAFNEEVCILDKLDNLFELDYPDAKINFFIGSDGSFDETNALIKQYPAIEKSNWHFFPFTARRGKPAVLNELVEKAIALSGKSEEHLLLITDASVLMETDVVHKLSSKFDDSKIGLVDSFIANTNNSKKGIGIQETEYISIEAKLKQWESEDGGYMIGPFGGCYMLRSKYFKAVPENYLVDDFFIAMEVFKSGGLCINDLTAICKESNSSDILEEYKRKSRIAAGNYQNFLTFRDILWPPFNKLSFNYISHKVLRWFGPFFIVLCLLFSLTLGVFGNLFYFILFLMTVTLLMVIPLVDYYLEGLGLNNRYLRFVRYFVVVNIAFFKGFVRFLKGIKSGAWDPPKRK
jgi:cellulose synthase/poly-beta-1,6-N-acetylglucosamine synthase-like glycosyltransferase